MDFPIIATVVQGVIITVIGFAAYQAGDGWFKSGTSRQFDSKEMAQATLVGWLLISGWAGPIILDFVQSGLSGLSFWQEAGIVLIASRGLTNEVGGWTQTDSLSKLQFLVGGSLLLLPMFGYQIPF